MSHFTVLIIGDNPEEQLEPFHEFESTGIDEYVQEIDITEAVLEKGLSYYGLEERVVSDESQIDVEGDHKYGYAIVQNGELVKAIDRTNPNAKWDWYQLGGRWRGYFQPKRGRHGLTGEAGVFENGLMSPHGVDSARKGDIDFEAMREEAGRHAAAYYDRFWLLVGDQPLPNWTKIRERHGKNIDKAREEYQNHPVSKILDNSEEFKNDFLFRDIMEMAETRGDYIEHAKRSRVVTFAVLYNGQWYERGEMGWWGMVSNEKEAHEWENEFYKLLEGLSDDTLLSIYDCHI